MANGSSARLAAQRAAEAYAAAAKHAAKIRESPKVLKFIETIAAVATRKFHNFRADEKASYTLRKVSDFLRPSVVYSS